MDSRPFMTDIGDVATGSMPPLAAPAATPLPGPAETVGVIGSGGAGGRMVRSYRINGKDCTRQARLY